jgi:chitodextrinase
LPHATLSLSLRRIPHVLLCFRQASRFRTSLFFLLTFLSLAFSACSNLSSPSTPPAVTPPTAPANLAALAISSTQINLSWTASTDNTGVTGYLVERCQGPGCANFAQVSTPTVPSFGNSGLAASTSYSYRVRATNAAGKMSAYSNTATTTTPAGADATPPTAPTNLAAAATSSTQINLSWTASTDNVGVTGYRVERCQGAGCANFVQIATPTATAFSNTGLTASTSYSYRVRATDAAGNLSSYSSTSTASTPAGADTTPPSAPANLAAAAASSTQINLSWTASTDNVGVTGYRVERCQGAGCANFVQIATPTVTTFNNTGLTASTSYSYRVRATDAAGNLSSYSNISSATTPAGADTTPPSAPANLAATAASSAQINLSWTASTDNVGVTGYRVERCQGAGCANFVQIATPTATTFNDTGLTASTSYTYRVRATDAAGNLSAYSNVASATTSASSSNISVSLSPKRGGVTLTQPLQFTATVSNDSQNLGVTWSVDSISGGSSSSGSISSSGLFTPSSSTTPGSHSITATSVADSTKSSSVSIAVTDLPGIFTHHYDPQRTGQNLKEYALSPATLSSSTFGALFSCSVNENGSVPGYVYAQPLYVASLTMSDGLKHNVLFVATESDFVYAFDADASPCLQLWKTSMLKSGESTVPDTDTGETGDLVPEIGVTSTPVIDPSTNSLFVCAKSKDSSGNYHHRLHSLSLITGAENTNSPAEITASGFNVLAHLQRPALLLSGSTVFLSFGSHGDKGTYHGWLMGYNKSALSQSFVWSSTDLSSNTEGALWGAGTGPALDSSGNVWVETANGNFDGSINFGDSVVKLSSSGSLLDFFTPFYQDTLRANDVDLGSGGVLILPPSVGSPAHPNLAVATGKPGGFYLLDQSNLGQFNSSSNNDVQELFPQGLNTSTIGGGVFGQTAYWNGNLYISVIGDSLRQFPISNASIAANSSSNSTHVFTYPAVIPVISANGSSGAIVWGLEIGGYAPSSPVILHAFNATNLASEIYTSPSSGSGSAPTAVKFTVPTVANGKVYVAGQGSITVFGLLPN